MERNCARKPLFEPTDVNLINFEIRSFRLYLKEMNLYLEAESEQIDQSMVELEKTIGDNEEKKDEITNRYIKSREFNNILFSSFVVSTYSYFESKLNNICRRCEKVFAFEIKLEDFKDQGFNRARKYLEKVCKLNMPDIRVFEKITFLSKVRNFIVHNGGSIKEKEILANMRKYKLNLDEDEFGNSNIILTFEYADYSLSILEEYLMTMIKANKEIKYQI